MTKEKQFISDLGWVVIENIAIIIVAGILTYNYSAWCLLMLFFCNTFKKE